MNRFLVLVASVGLLGCEPKEGATPQAAQNMQAKCTTLRDGLVIYKTAAGFKLSRPEWMHNLSFEERFTNDCELASMKLHFALVGNELLPVPHPGIKHPKSVALPSSYDQLTLFLNFQDVRTQGPGEPSEWACSSKHKVYKFPEFGIQMCGIGPSPNVTTMPFYPRFEIADGRNPPTSMKCRHEDIEGRKIDDITNLSVPYACRGYWAWRPGAHAMFDLGTGEVLKKLRLAIGLAETTLNSWVLPE